MNLRDQIYDITKRKINPDFAKHTQLPTQVQRLAGEAFAKQWEEDKDTRAIRKAYQLLDDQGWVPPSEGEVG